MATHAAMEWMSETGTVLCPKHGLVKELHAERCGSGPRPDYAPAPFHCCAHQASSPAFHSKGIASGDLRCALGHPSQLGSKYKAGNLHFAQRSAPFLPTAGGGIASDGMGCA